MSRNSNNYSLVYWCPDPSPHRCGYCKNPQGSISNGMWAETLTVQDYQNLIDRGWRRSGVYCYKPIMEQICCPQYTIRCDTLNFQLTKSQKKVIKKFNKYINDDVLNKTESYESCDNISDAGCWRERPSTTLAAFEETPPVTNNDKQANHQEFSVDKQCTSEKIEPSGSREKPSNQPKSGVGADPTRPPCKKAKTLRLARKQEKLLKRGMSLEQLPKNNQQKSLEEFLGAISDDSKHKLKFKLINTHDPEWERYKSIEFELYRKYQMVVHNDPPEKCTIEGFCRFLVNSPLKNQKISKESNLNYGSYHQLYWIDEKLIAVGVIDILPKCVSAVYFFYDPDYRGLTLGTYGSMREVELVRSLHKISQSIQYYYMGFYIHSCPKMRYKGKLVPSYLLCPETYQWIEIEKCLPKLDVDKYARLIDDIDAIDENLCNSKDIDKIKLQIYRDRIITFHEFKTKYLSKSKQQIFDLIGRTIGKKCSRTIIIKCN